jgi:hypothetical protein
MGAAQQLIGVNIKTRATKVTNPDFVTACIRPFSLQL